MLEYSTNFGHSEWQLRHQNQIGSTRYTSVTSDPTSMATHYFDHHYSVMRFGGSVQFVDRLGHCRYGSIKAKCKIGAVDIIVDGFRNSDDRQSIIFPE